MIWTERLHVVFWHQQKMVKKKPMKLLMIGVLGCIKSLRGSALGQDMLWMRFSLSTIKMNAQHGTAGLEAA